MNTVTLPSRNLSITYEDRGAGPPVVLLHAFPMCREMWQPQFEALSVGRDEEFTLPIDHALGPRGLDAFRTGCRVLAPDFPGFGGSTPADGMTMEQMADVVAEFLTAAGVAEPIVLCGLSMGGYAAFAFARRHPGRLRGLILADTKPEADNDAAKANRNKQIAALTDGSLTPSGLVEQVLPKLLGEDIRAHSPAVVAEVKRIGAAQLRGGLAAALTAMRDRLDATPEIGNIRVPTLVLVGEQDAVTPPDGARRTADGIPGSQLVVMPRAGHLSNLEDPPAFNAAVKAFLAGLPRT